MDRYTTSVQRRDARRREDHETLVRVRRELPEESGLSRACFTCKEDVAIRGVHELRGQSGHLGDLMFGGDHAITKVRHIDPIIGDRWSCRKERTGVEVRYTGHDIESEENGSGDLTT